MVAFGFCGLLWHVVLGLASLGWFSWFELMWSFSLFLYGCVPWVGFGCVCCNMFVTPGLDDVCLVLGGVF